MAENNGEKGATPIGWVMRMRDPAFADWDAFTAWLEADAGNAAAYDEVMLAVEEADAALALATPVAAAPPFMPVATRPTRRWRLPGAMTAGAMTAVAATIAGIASYSLMTRSASFTTIQTAAGERRSIQLHDGTRINLNGGTQIAIGKDAARLVRMERGQATFHVVHDAAHPLVVQLGDVRLQDVGTRFDVVRTGSATSVAVAEGAVIYDPDGQAIRLTAGQRLAASAGRIELARADPASIGSWRQGQLIYDGSRIGQVAEDMARNVGVPVQVDPAIALRRFSGVILLDGDAKAVFARAALLLDVVADHDKDGWHLRARTRAAP